MKLILILMSFLVLVTVSYAQEARPSPDPSIGTSTIAPGYESLPKGTTYSDLKFSVKPSAYVRPDGATRRKRYINSVVGPFALGREVASAGISTWRNSPPEWGTKWEGFGRRVASNFGKNVIKQSTKFGLDEAFKVDSHFYRSDNKKFSARFTNALISPVTARNAAGKRVIGFPNLVGTYTANIIAYETWYPARYDWKDGVKTGTISLGFTAAFNLVKEFVWKK